MAEKAEPPGKGALAPSGGTGPANVSLAVVGGLAVSVRTEPRFTRDLDVAAAVASERGAEGLVPALQREGFGPEPPLPQRFP